MTSVLDRFLRYVRIDTRSDAMNSTPPSTLKQMDLARLLVEELKELGLSEVDLDEYGFVTALLPGNLPAASPTAPTIGLIAHMDTSPDYSGTNVNPQIIENYDGGDILLMGAPGVNLSPADFPELLNYKGQTLITTDGTTLLGADDKAGIAEIMAALEELVKHPERPHGAVKIAFTQDEETGRGAAFLDVKKFGADFAYTLDGGAVGEISYENFNAAAATVRIKGRSVHPGSAKNRMVNALQVAVEFHNTLPAGERPEYTEGYEGFFHLNSLKGSVEEAEMNYIIRDHDRTAFDRRKELMIAASNALNEKYGAGTFQLELRDQYFNMKDCILPVHHILDTAIEAMQELGITPNTEPVRGGTDGAQFSYRGLPTPNLFTGGHNFHGRFEFIPVESMEKAVAVIVRIIELYSKRISGNEGSSKQQE
jgi:tripeptide aminopeptidase